MLLAYIGVPHGAKWSLVITTFAVILTQYIHVVLMKQLGPFRVLIFYLNLYAFAQKKFYAPARINF